MVVRSRNRAILEPEFPVIVFGTDSYSGNRSSSSEISLFVKFLWIPCSGWSSEKKASDPRNDNPVQTRRATQRLPDPIPAKVSRSHCLLSQTPYHFLVHLFTLLFEKINVYLLFLFRNLMLSWQFNIGHCLTRIFLFSYYYFYSNLLFQLFHEELFSSSSSFFFFWCV